MIALSSAVPGVLSAHDPRVTPSLRTGPLGGDVIVYAEAGWRFSDPDQLSNPIPGNHGHPATTPIPFFVAGGHRLVPGRRTSSAGRDRRRAPTCRLLRVGAPRGGYDGRSRLPRR